MPFWHVACSYAADALEVGPEDINGGCQMLKKLIPIAVTFAMAVGMGAANATTISGGLTTGENLVIDESREAYVDANHSGFFDAGDVIIGYIKIDKFSTTGLSANNQVYGVFSQQVLSANPTTGSVVFTPTTVSGLTLSDLTGCSNCSDGLFALYDRTTPYTTDIIQNPLVTATDMQDYVDFIVNNGTLELVGSTSVAGNFIVSAVQQNPLTGQNFLATPNSLFVGLSSSITIASTAAALTFTENNTGLAFAPSEVTLTPLGFVPAGFDTSQLSVNSGTVSGSGAAGPTPQNWLKVTGFTQCLVGGVSTPCGFIDKNNFNVNVAQVPEPGSLALIGLALMGAVGVGMRRKQQ
jgi:hypothetical protein